MGIAVLFLSLAMLANSFANVLMKKAAVGSYSTALGMYFSPMFLGGALLFGLNMLFYSRALKHFPLAVAYPVLVGGSLIIVALVSHFGLQEPISLKQMAGMALIMAGIWMVV